MFIADAVPLNPFSVSPAPNCGTSKEIDPFGAMLIALINTFVVVGDPDTGTAYNVTAAAVVEKLVTCTRPLRSNDVVGVVGTVNIGDAALVDSKAGWNSF